MATWDSYTQKSTPADNDTLMIKDTSGGANKRTPFSGVWNWILTKLTNAVISQLETTNKSIIPAINELNSKTRLTDQSITQPSNVDGIEITLWAVIAQRIGRAAYIQFNVQGTISKNKEFITLFTLPEELRPTSTVIINYITQDGHPMMIRLDSTTYEVQIYANVESGVKVDIFFLRQAVSYVCNGD